MLSFQLFFISRQMLNEIMYVCMGMLVFVPVCGLERSVRLRLSDRDYSSEYFSV